MKTKISIFSGDITQIKTDAIVNAANKTLLGGGGVDGAIHRVAGHGLLEECKTLGGCEIGEAKITKAYNLPAKHIIHTVGPYYAKASSGRPIFGVEDGREAELLALCYTNSLKLADEHNIKSIAFPCISTGVFHYPKDEAAKVAVSSVKKYFKENPQSKIEKVIFAALDELDYNIYTQMI